MTATLTTLVNFTGPNGAQPYGSLIIDAAGDLFGTTNSGPNGGDGTVFEIVNTGAGYASAPTTLVILNATVTEASPYGGLIADAAGDLFGTTAGGGANGDGSVFEIVKTSAGYGSTATTLISFNGANGQGPQASLIADAAGDLFGTTTSGGANGDGTVFELVKTAAGYASTPTILVSFNGANGNGPSGKLVADAAGNLFGTTQVGGVNNDGTVFEITKTSAGYASTPSVLASFNFTNGYAPEGGVIADAAGNLFGTTNSGGANNDGTVFEITKTSAGYASTPTVLASFNGADGAYADSGLIMDAAGNLFGTTAGGGANDDGTVFEIVKTGAGYASTPIVLASFDGANGIGPLASLIVNAAGDLFGTTAGGGANGGGTVFEITNSGFVVAPVIAPPTITGAVANQQGFLIPTHLFGSVVIGDVNVGQQETITVTSSTAVPFGLNGVLYDPHAATDGSHYARGVYTVTGSASAVTADLRGLLFIAGLGATDFTIKVTDTAGATAIDHTTSVVGISFSDAFHFG